MIIYILPSNVEQFTKKVERATRHLVQKPSIQFSEPKLMKKRTIVDDAHGRMVFKEAIEVVEVTIDDITSGDWIPVADVYHREDIVAMIDRDMYGLIPEKFGCDYNVCDYCGHSHRDRVKSHIVYNTVTKEWKQIGTACGRQMFKEGDLCAFMVKLGEYINACGGCMDYDFDNWCRRQPDHSWQKVFTIDTMVQAVKQFREDGNKSWVKSYYDQWDNKCGTTVDFKSWLDVNEDKLGEVDQEYVGKVKSFVGGLGDSDFSGSLKTVFGSEFIRPFEVYAPFFAIKMYEESLTKGDWDEAVKDIKAGQTVVFRNVDVKVEMMNNWDGSICWKAEMEKDGVKYVKWLSGSTVMEKYNNGDGTYSFSADVKRVDNRRREVYLGGRCRKA